MSVGRDDQEDALSTLRWLKAELVDIQIRLTKATGMLMTATRLLEKEVEREKSTPSTNAVSHS